MILKIGNTTYYSEELEALLKKLASSIESWKDN